MDAGRICEWFDLGTPVAKPTYVARGELGRVSRLATTSGLWAIKEIDLFLPSIDDANANVELQESMLAVGVHLPRPRRTIDGHGLFENVRVYEWLDLEPLPAGDAEVEAIVAAELARIHLHAPPTNDPPDRWYCEGPTRDEWRMLVEEGAGCWWARAVDDLLDEIADLPHPNHSPIRVCHLDVCPENVFFSGRRLTIIDWENAGPAAPAQDFGSTVWDFSQGNAVRTRSFFEHYRRHGGPIEQLDASVFDTARVVQSNLIDFHCRRTLERETPPEARERANRALRTLLARPLTRQLVDALSDSRCP